MRRTLRPALLIGAVVLFAAPSVRGQSLHGVVIDAATQRPIPNAEVLVDGPDEWEFQFLTGDDGRFDIGLPEAGVFWVRGRALGYLETDSARVRVETDFEGVEVELRLAASPIELNPLTVVARGTALRHRATWDGFLRRRDVLPRVGNSRAVSSEDGEMKGSTRVGDVLDWFPDPRGCVEVFIDGQPANGWGDVTQLSITSVDGVEFYRSVVDAPVEYRGRGSKCARSINYSVLALWRKR